MRRAGRGDVRNENISAQKILACGQTHSGNHFSDPIRVRSSSAAPDLGGVWRAEEHTLTNPKTCPTIGVHLTSSQKARSLSRRKSLSVLSGTGIQGNQIKGNGNEDGIFGSSSGAFSYRVRGNCGGASEGRGLLPKQRDLRPAALSEQPRWQFLQQLEHVPEHQPVLRANGNQIGPRLWERA